MSTIKQTKELPPSHYAIPSTREFQIRDDSGKLDHEMLDSAYMSLSGWSTRESAQYRQRTEIVENERALVELRKLYAQAGWEIPTVKEQTRSAFEKSFLRGLKEWQARRRAEKQAGRLWLGLFRLGGRS